jgi:PAS domain S-box-containing protein
MVPQHPLDFYDNLILDQLPDGLVVTDAADIIRRANLKAREITGWEIDELLGMPFAKLISRDELAGIAQTRDGGDPSHLERYHCLLRTKSGERWEISVAFFSYGTSGASGSSNAGCWPNSRRSRRWRRSGERRPW